jgi:diguanylate cyclase
MDVLLSRLSDSLASARSLEDLARPLLEMLEEVTRMESTYLTRIDLQQSLQHVLYARNTQRLQIPEGLDVPWGDTLCRRALQEGRVFTPDVPACWGDSEAAASLGIQSYVSVPVNLSDGVVFGTLCAASSRPAHLPNHAEKVLRLFAKLIAQQVEREQLMQALQQRNAQLTEMALIDSLTGVPNRRALYQELERLLAWARRSGRSVMVAFVDLDDFKPINDQYGHEAGDALLCAVARQLQAVCRESDYLARMGGDEFVFTGLGPATGQDGAEAIAGLHQRLERATACHVVLPSAATLDYPGASVGVVCLDPTSCTVDAALRRADAAMYVVKKLRHK